MQCVSNRCKDLFERKNYFGVRCTRYARHVPLTIFYWRDSEMALFYNLIQFSSKIWQFCSVFLDTIFKPHGLENFSHLCGIKQNLAGACKWSFIRVHKGLLHCYCMFAYNRLLKPCEKVLQAVILAVYYLHVAYVRQMSCFAIWESCLLKWESFLSRQECCLNLVLW